MSAALKLVPTHAGGRVLLPDGANVVVGNPREIAVAMFRELADKLESGEYDGARVEWRQGRAELITVTMDAERVQLLTTTIEEG